MSPEDGAAINIKRTLILSLIGVLLAIVLSGCLVTIEPTPAGATSGLVITTPVSTNVVTDSRISKALTAAGAAMGFPEAGTAAGAALVVLIWVWRNIRARRAEKRGVSNEGAEIPV